MGQRIISVIFGLIGIAIFLWGFQGLLEGAGIIVIVPLLIGPGA